MRFSSIRFSQFADWALLGFVSLLFYLLFSGLAHSADHENYTVHTKSDYSIGATDNSAIRDDLSTPLSPQQLLQRMQSYLSGHDGSSSGGCACGLNGGANEDRR